MCVCVCAQLSASVTLLDDCSTFPGSRCVTMATARGTSRKTIVLVADLSVTSLKSKKELVFFFLTHAAEIQLPFLPLKLI